MVGLLVVGMVGAVLVLYAADRVVKAWSRGRRLRAMSDRLDAVTARADVQHEQRRAAVRASAELTSVMPAIERPPLTLPGGPSPGAARPRADRERTGPQDHGSGPVARRPAHTGEQAARSAERPGRGSDRPGHPAEPGARKGHPTVPRRPVR